MAITPKYPDFCRAGEMLLHVSDHQEFVLKLLRYPERTGRWTDLAAELLKCGKSPSTIPLELPQRELQERQRRRPWRRRAIARRARHARYPFRIPVPAACADP
jgi:hypothetical protein